MTFSEILNSEKDVLTPADIAPVLGVHPQAINIQAERGKLPFPAFRSGNRTKIPRIGFVNWWTGKEEK